MVDREQQGQQLTAVSALSLSLDKYRDERGGTAREVLIFGNYLRPEPRASAIGSLTI